MRATLVGNGTSRSGPGIPGGLPGLRRGNPTREREMAQSTARRLRAPPRGRLGRGGALAGVQRARREAALVRRPRARIRLRLVLRLHRPGRLRPGLHGRVDLRGLHGRLPARPEPVRDDLGSWAGSTCVRPTASSTRWPRAAAEKAREGAVAVGRRRRARKCRKPRRFDPAQPLDENGRPVGTSGEVSH